MQPSGTDLLRKIYSINDSFNWIETEADKLMTEFEGLMHVYENEIMSDEDYDKLEEIYNRMGELESRARLNTKMYNASVHEARKYFMQQYNALLPPDITEIPEN